MTDSGFKDYFTTASVKYGKFRPHYPIELVNTLADLCDERISVWDCGCGTGQLSVLLAERFAHVIATDASVAQINNATPHSSVEYRTALAESSDLPAASFDLVTVAQAAHWLNLPDFYKEVRRVAKPKAVIALITYGILHVEGETDLCIQDFYYNKVGDYWPAERAHVEDRYVNLPFPFDEVTVPKLVMTEHWCLDELLGYISTWSAISVAKKANNEDLLIRLREQLSLTWSNASDRKLVSWPLTVRAGYVHPN